jgi:hypothetical protein
MLKMYLVEGFQPCREVDEILRVSPEESGLQTRAPRECMCFIPVVSR